MSESPDGEEVHWNPPCVDGVIYKLSVAYWGSSELRKTDSRAEELLRDSFQDGYGQPQSFVLESFDTRTGESRIVPVVLESAEPWSEQIKGDVLSATARPSGGFAYRDGSVIWVLHDGRIVETDVSNGKSQIRTEPLVNVSGDEWNGVIIDSEIRESEIALFVQVGDENNRKEIVVIGMDDWQVRQRISVDQLNNEMPASFVIDDFAFRPKKP